MLEIQITKERGWSLGNVFTCPQAVTLKEESVVRKHKLGEVCQVSAVGLRAFLTGKEIGWKVSVKTVNFVTKEIHFSLHAERKQSDWALIQTVQ